jgi:hypothetical protein
LTAKLDSPWFIGSAFGCGDVCLEFDGVGSSRSYCVNEGVCHPEAAIMRLRNLTNDQTACPRVCVGVDAEVFFKAHTYTTSAKVFSIRRKYKAPVMRTVRATSEDKMIVGRGALLVPSMAHRNPSITPTMGFRP